MWTGMGERGGERDNAEKGGGRLRKAGECKGKGASGGRGGLVSALRLVSGLLRPVAARVRLARAHPRLGRAGSTMGGWRRRRRWRQGPLGGRRGIWVRRVFLGPSGSFVFCGPGVPESGPPGVVDGGGGAPGATLGVGRGRSGRGGEAEGAVCGVLQR